jgi:hypothetical protein
MGITAVMAAGGDDAPAHGSAVWLGWDAWVSPVARERSRNPSLSSDL